MLEDDKEEAIAEVCILIFIVGCAYASSMWLSRT